LHRLVSHSTTVMRGGSSPKIHKGHKGRFDPANPRQNHPLAVRGYSMRSPAVIVSSRLIVTQGDASRRGKERNETLPPNRWSANGKKIEQFFS
jgi:hypothetical protein